MHPKQEPIQTQLTPVAIHVSSTQPRRCGMHADMTLTAYCSHRKVHKSGGSVQISELARRQHVCYLHTHTHTHTHTHKHQRRVSIMDMSRLTSRAHAHPNAPTTNLMRHTGQLSFSPPHSLSHACSTHARMHSHYLNTVLLQLLNNVRRHLIFLRGHTHSHNIQNCHHIHNPTCTTKRGFDHTFLLRPCSCESSPPRPWGPRHCPAHPRASSPDLALHFRTLPQSMHIRIRMVSLLRSARTPDRFRRRRACAPPCVRGTGVASTAESAPPACSRALQAFGINGNI